MNDLYCSVCGHPLQNKQHDGRLRRWCERCAAYRYERYNVAAAALLEQDGKLLLLRRARDPFKGMWNLPSGFVELDETPAQAAIRELKEETGLDANAGRLQDVYRAQDDPRGPQLLHVYYCFEPSGTLQETSEATEARFFAPADIPQELSGGGNDRAVAAWRASQS